MPETLLDRYLIERDRQGRAESFFRDHRSERPLFRDRGGSLVSDRAYPDAVVDMLKIARHRGWDRIRVSGDAAFRREVWIQAQSLGLEVAGHRPRDRDRQAAGQHQLAPSPSRSDLHDRLARASVVVRRLIADPAAQARLIAGALERAGRAERDRSHARDRQR
ncbi:LPD7 domain-containing protein [Brevundimonas sp.]|uniref:LPD7 domain-containing protein n=1 Tax=Brevundimonas sp. TaxID=1871086 RepID=UPI003AFFD34E